MDQLPKIVQRGLQGTAKPGVHPDADLLTAFAEKSLNDRERSQVLQHLASCADCREVVSLAMPQIAATPAPSPSVGGSSWLSWPVLRWGALAACVVVVGAAVTLHYDQRQAVQTPLAPPQTASSGDYVLKQTQVFKQPNEELAAKIVPPLPIQPERDLGVASKLAKQREKSSDVGAFATRAVVPMPNRLEKNEKDQLASNRLDTLNAVQSADKPVPPALVAAAPAPLPTGKAEPTAPEAGARNAAADYTPKAMTETVTVEGATTAELETSQTAELKTKVRRESQKKIQAAGAAAGAAVAVGGRKADTRSAEIAQTTLADDAKRAQSAHVALRWTVSGDGALQRSLDSGKTWQPVQVATNVIFRALAANDSDIWVGGAAGTLYHSSDAGEHWIQVNPVADSAPLTADIVTVEFADPRHGKLTTANRETWTTNDAGATWQKR